jgi:hypothetical protein
MPNRTRPRPPKAKMPYGYGTSRTVHRIPRTRRRDAQPIVLVVPERPTLTRRAAGALGLWLWEHRRTWAPTGIAVLALPTTALGHAAFWWAGLVLAPLAAAPLGWLTWMGRHRPADDRAVRRWRQGLVLLATAAATWASLALAVGPLTGPIGLLWLLITATSQVLWLRTRSTSTDPIEEIV